MSRKVFISVKFIDPLKKGVLLTDLGGIPERRLKKLELKHSTFCVHCRYVSRHNICYTIEPLQKNQSSDV